MPESTSLIKKLIYNIRQHSNGSVYLFGSTLRDFLLTGHINNLDVTINEKDKDIQNKITGTTLNNISVDFIFGNEVDYSHEFYTIDNIYALIDIDFDGNIEIQSSNNGLVDFNKKIIKLTKAGKNYLLTSPKFILDTITFISENNFILDSGTISTFMQEKNNIKNVSRRDIYDFFKKIVSYDHPRKIVSLVNTLGLSKELFDIKLTETSIVNHLKSDDVYEFMAIIFSDIDPSDLKRVLIGVSPKDIDLIKNISESISLIENEDIETAKKIIGKIDSHRIQNIIRLLYAMKYKTLAKMVRHQKNINLQNKLCVNENTIKTTFNISDDDEIKRILEKVTNKVILDQSFNDVYKILTFIQHERE